DSHRRAGHTPNATSVRSGASMNLWMRPHRNSSRGRTARRPFRLSIEQLEDRVVPVVAFYPALPVGPAGYAFTVDPRSAVLGNLLTGVVDVGRDCTGTLIALGGDVVGSRFVITAAHCFLTPTVQRIYLNDVNATYRLSLYGTTPINAGNEG